MSFHLKKFSTIRISVANVQASRDWYRSFLSVAPFEDLENFVSFRLGDTQLDLALADGKSPLSQGGSVGYWLVDDVDKVIAHAINLGGKVYRGPLKVEEIRRTIVQITDPFGGITGFESDWSHL